LPSMRPPTA
jgi:hypothetical protein